MKNNFISKFTRGDLVDLDDFIEEWHISNSNLALHEFLGFSWEEFASVVKRNVIPLKFWIKRLESKSR